MSISPLSSTDVAHGPDAPNAMIATNLQQLLRLMQRFRSSLTVARGDDNEWLQNHLLAAVAASAPVRASALAETIEADPSTVSRQVAALVKRGLLERRADPDDGRASLLVLTAAGHALHRRHIERRDAHYNHMLGEWTLEDRRAFAALLGRFTRDFDNYKSVMYADALARRAPDATEENQ